MAFQTGSQVRPELGRADVSGFARGGMAIGAGVLQGIENYQEQKQITSFALSDLEGRMTADPSILAAMQQAGQNNPKIAKALKSLNEGDYKQNDVLTLSGFASSLQSTKAAMQLATLTQAKLDSLSQPKLPSVKDAQNLKEYVTTLTSPKGNDLVVRGGMLYDKDIAFDDPLPADDPAVIAALSTKEGKEILTGYGDAIYGGTVDDDGTPVEPAEIIETPGMNAQEEPTGSRASQLLRSIGDVNAKMGDVGSTSRAIPLGLKNFIFSPERTPFTESISSAKSKMESVDPFLRFFTKGLPF